MKLVIAFQTCERLNFFKKAVETLLEYNPCMKDRVWVIADDASKDGKTQKYIKSLSFIDHTIFNESRLGISGTLKRIIDVSAAKGDAILYIQNDWFCSRSLLDQYRLDNPTRKDVRNHQDRGRSGDQVGYQDY